MENAKRKGIVGLIVAVILGLLVVFRSVFLKILESLIGG